MLKNTREVVFEGINEEIKEALNELGYTKIEYLDEFCEENDFELIVKTHGYKPHEEACKIGWNDEETSEYIRDVLLYLYDGELTDDNYLMYDIYITDGVEKTLVEVLDVKDYTELVVVDEHGIEVDLYGHDFINDIIYKVDESLDNNNLQYTRIYKEIFGEGNTENMNDDEYNTKYNCLIDRIVKSVRRYMLENIERRFNINANTHYVSCYFFYEVSSIYKNYYIDDICEVLDYKDR